MGHSQMTHFQICVMSYKIEVNCHTLQVLQSHKGQFVLVFVGGANEFQCGVWSRCPTSL